MIPRGFGGSGSGLPPAHICGLPPVEAPPMVHIRIGDISVPCASTHVAAQLIGEMRIYVVCETSEEVSEMTLATADQWPPPIIKGPPESGN